MKLLFGYDKILICGGKKLLFFMLTNTTALDEMKIQFFSNQKTKLYMQKKKKQFIRNKICILLMNKKRQDSSVPLFLFCLSTAFSFFSVSPSEL